MKLKKVLLLGFLSFGFLGYSQEEATKSKEYSQDDCMANFSTYYHQSYKPKKYVEAYEFWKICFYECMDKYQEKHKKSIITHGKKILNAKIKIAKDSVEKSKTIQELLEYYDKSIEYLPENKYKYLGYKSIDMFKNQLNLKESYKNLRDVIDNQTEPSISVLDAFFKNSIVLYNKKELSDIEVFADFDFVMEYIENLSSEFNTEINNLTQDSTKVLTKKEQKKLKLLNKLKKGLKTLGKNSNKLISPIATPERLVPLYTQNFEKNKTNKGWLQSALSMLGRKKCQKEKIYKDIAAEYYNISPSYKSAKALGLLNVISGDMTSATKYYEEAITLASNDNQKFDCYVGLAKALQKKNKVRSRKYAREAIKIDRSNYEPYLIIGLLYIESANECGSNEFEKKAVYWAALNKLRMAKKLAEDEATINNINKFIKGYSSQTPDKGLIFQFGYIDKTTYRINCWINETVRIPKV